MLNDFLGNLSSRALQKERDTATTGRLVPRLASRFEPANGPVMLAMDRVPVGENLEEVETHQSRTARKSSPAKARQEVEEAPSIRMEAAPSTFPVRPTWEPEPSRLMSQDENQEDRYFRERERTKGRLEAPAAHASLADPEPSMSPGRLGEPESDLQPDLPRLSRPGPLHDGPEHSIEPPVRPETGGLLPANRAAADPKREPPGEPAAGALPAGQTLNVLERVEITRIESQAPVSELRSSLVPSLALAGHKPQKTMTESRAEPPTIHVTIGRVEVKATVSNALPKRAAAKPSAMSLEEYLRQRQGGDR